MITFAQVQPVQPTPSLKDLPTDGNPWVIAAAILIASLPHLWSFITGAQKSRADLTTRLLENLQQSYTLQNTSAEELKALVQTATAKPTELAQSNSLQLRDLLGETAEIRERLMKLERKIDYIAEVSTRTAQRSGPSLPPGEQ